MIEFTSERIENIRWAIKTKAEVQTVSPLIIEMLDEIERLHTCLQELEQERFNKCSDCCYVTPLLHSITRQED